MIRSKAVEGWYDEHATQVWRPSRQLDGLKESLLTSLIIFTPGFRLQSDTLIQLLYAFSNAFLSNR